MIDRHPNIYNEFDLETARKAGQADERERIIKLVESEMQGRDSWLDVIELIKGDQNA